MTKASRWALGRRGKRRRPAIVSTAPFYDDFYGFGDTTLNGRLPLSRPASSSQLWTVASGAVMVLADGHLEARFPTQSSATAYMDYGTDSADVTLEFELASTGTNRSVSAMLRFQDTSNFWMIQAHLDQGTFRIVQVIAGSNNNRANGTYTYSAGTRYAVRGTCDGSDFTGTLYTVSGTTLTPVTLNTGTNPLTHSAASPDLGVTLHGIRTSNTVNQGAEKIYKFEGIPAPVPTDETITVAVGSTLTSKMLPGVSHVNNPSSWREAGWTNAKTALAAAVGIHNVHLFPFGLKDPWTLTSPTTWIPGQTPVPSTPNKLDDGAINSFKVALDKVREIDADDPIIVTLYGAPWWMKGRLNTDGSTTPCSYPADQFTDEGRVMTQYLPYWQQLVQAAAEIAMQAPYNVRIFQVWNEMKGYYRDRFNTPQKWASDYYAGTTGLNADHGYSYFYKVTTDGVLAAAAALEIDDNDVLMGGPYSLIRSQYNRDADSLPSSGYSMLYNRVWGTMNKQGIKTVEDFHDQVAAHSLKQDYLCIDFGPGNTDGVFASSEWDIRTKFTDLMTWVAAELTRIGRTSLPIIGSEVYSSSASIDMDTAPSGLLTVLKAETHKRLLEGGLTYPLAWGPEQTADDTSNADSYIINETSTSEGGTIAPWGEVYGMFKDNFGPSTVMYAVSAANGLLSGIASDTKLMLWNKTGDSLTATVEGAVVNFTPYETKLLDR